MGPYSMSYMHLGPFLLTHLEQHFVQQTGICKLDLFCARGHLTCHAMGHPLHKGQCLLDQCVILHVSHLQQELSLASILHATCVIFVIHVDVFIIFINLSN